MSTELAKEAQGLGSRTVHVFIIKVAQNQSKIFQGPGSLALAITSRDDRENTSCPRRSLVSSFPVCTSPQCAPRVEERIPALPPLVFLHLPYLRG